MKPPDLTGQKFGRLTVLEFSHRTVKGSKIYWKCLCECGTEKNIFHYSLINGDAFSCGCYQKECAAKQKRGVPGESSKNYVYSYYRKNASLRNRCFDLGVDEFLAITQQNCAYCGIEPFKSALSTGDLIPFVYNGVDRIDSNGGYEKDNVVACCTTCNYAKRRLTHAEFLGWIDRITAHRYKEITTSGL